jgi:hypothetical protein
MQRRLEQIDESIARYLSQLDSADRQGEAVPEAKITPVIFRPRNDRAVHGSIGLPVDIANAYLPRTAPCDVVKCGFSALATLQPVRYQITSLSC